MELVYQVGASGDISAAVAAIIGALIGSLSSLLATWLAHWLRTKSEADLDKKRKLTLKTLLSGEKYTWRNIETLAAAIGADHLKTASLLLDIDARASNTGSGSWALVSRAPYPDDMKADPE